MKNLNILIVSAALVISKASACIPECWAEKFGYPCCNPTITEALEVDKYGEWSVENGKRCGIHVYNTNMKCGPSVSTYEDCDNSYCDDVIAVDDDGTVWGFDTKVKKRCTLNIKDSKCASIINETCWSALLGYKCCKNTYEPLYKDKNGFWSIENDKWCGIERCSDCSNIESIDKYGNIWGYNKNSISKCIIDKKDEKCSAQLEKSCRSAKLGYMCCKNTKQVVLEDDFGSWGIEDGKWCGFN